MKITSAPPVLFLWIFIALSFTGTTLRAQTILFSEDFETWNGSLTCLPGWNCATTPACTAGLACNWGRNDIFGSQGQPSAADCSGAGFYARCHSSQMIFGDIPAISSPPINLSGIPASDPVALTFCFINAGAQIVDSDGFQVSFSNDGGTTWQAYYLDFNVYNAWTNLSVPVPGTFRSSNFRFRIEGVANQASADMGIDDLSLVNNAIPCNAQPSVISVSGSGKICRDSTADVRTFSQTGSTSNNYVYVITDTAGIVHSVIAGNTFDFNELAPAQYEVRGVSYDGLITANAGKSMDSISATVCHVISANYLTFVVTEITATAFVVSDYNGAAISRYGGRDGAVMVTTSGGSGALSYLWNTQPPQTTSTAIGLGAGEYHVSVSDTSGCHAGATVSLSQPDSLLISLQISSDYHGTAISCTGASDGTVQVQVTGGISPYTYQWAHNTQLSGNTAAGLGAGTYTVTVRDANGAEKTDTVLLHDPLPVTLTHTISQLKCASQADGSIAVHATGGVAPYSYNWDHGPSTPAVEGLSSGSYRCQVTDANGCQASSTFVIEDKLPMQIEGIVSNNICFGAADGYIGINILGGTAPYFYRWSSGAEVSDLFGLTAGSYTLTVADSVGCTATESFTIQEPQPWQVDIFTRPDNGKSVGSAQAVVSGGVPPYQYSWTTGDTGATVSGLLAGSYALKITDANGCEWSQSFEIDPSDRPECLEIHTGFSPNGDGINETWHIPCLTYFPDNKITVVNRWGQELFSAQGYDNSWGGTTNGQPLPDGTYFYIIEIQTNNNRRQFKGTVNIIR
ncbi:MAG: gliding motility-associated C-terminal domain-containing protein [Bacteroidia bacterium]